MKKKQILLLVLLLLAILAMLIYRAQINSPKIRIGDYYIPLNIRARINNEKEYFLKLWDYHLPENEEFTEQRKKALAEFKQRYPKVWVEVTLLDVFGGDDFFKSQLKEGKGPDVYCSYGQTPEFDYKRQIPIGYYLKKAEINKYDRRLLELYSMYGVVCRLPYFEEYEMWLGNVDILEQQEVDWKNIERIGWNWEDVSKIENSLPHEKKIFSEENSIFDFAQGNSAFLPDARYGIKKHLAKQVSFRMVEFPLPDAVVNQKPKQKCFRSRTLNIYRSSKSDDAQVALAAELAKLLSGYRKDCTTKISSEIMLKIKKE